MTDNSSIDPREFLNRPEYNQIITCPRTNTLVKFAEAGAIYKETLLFVVPSFCSRFIGAPLLSPLADHYGMRIISLDRPGCGGTPQCSLKDRLAVASDNTRSVLEHLNIDPERTAILTHSAGSVFTLHLLDRHPDLFPRDPRVFVTSGWVPSSVSGQIGLDYVPSVLVSCFHHILPVSLPIVKSVGASLAFSHGILSGVNTEAVMPPDVIPRPAPAPGAPHPKHTLRVPKIVYDAIPGHVTRHESTQGVSDDYLLCLGRGEGSIDSEWLINTVNKISHAFRQQDRKVYFRLWWGEKDVLIPIKGQRWYANLLRDQGDVFEVSSVQLPNAGHDDLLSLAAVMYPIFEEAKATLGA